ncbi:hypothetical protein [Novosphingobium sp. EMRT-2]|nr:hypothetical protein [Novosphingobium sp. EMRT-2]
MPRALTSIKTASMPVAPLAEGLRAVIVLGCALALILAGRALPF